VDAIFRPQSQQPAAEKLNERLKAAAGSAPQPNADGGPPPNPPPAAAAAPPPEEPGDPAGPAEKHVDVGTWDRTLGACESAAMDAGLSPGDLSARVGRWAVAAGAKGKEEQKTTEAQRRDLVAAVRDGRLGADGKITPRP
jgi:hypothetical protein